MQSAENLLVCKRFYCIYIYILYIVNRPLTLNSYDHADIELTRQFRPETEIKSICIQPATASQTEPTEAAGYLGKEQALYIPTSSASYSIYIGPEFQSESLHETFVLKREQELDKC